MIEINLLPEELRKKEAFKLPKLPIIPITISIVGILIFIQVLLLALIQARKATLNSLNNKYSSIALSSVEAEALNGKIDKLSSKVKMMETLNASRFIWSKKLNDISDSLVSGIWLRRLYIEKEKMEGGTISPMMPSPQVVGAGQAGVPGASMPPKVAVPKEFLVLKGSALVQEGREPGTVGKFVDALKENKSFFEDFEEIELRGVERRAVGQSKTEVIDFEISCRFKEGRGP